MKYSAGFTLIELMITVAVAGILAMVGYPSYIESIQKAHRSEAQAVLITMLNSQESYYSDELTYTTDKTIIPDHIMGKLQYYSTKMESCGASSNGAITCILITASPIAGSVQEGTQDIWVKTNGYGTERGPTEYWKD